MIISQAQLDTLMYWAKLGVSGFVPHADQYRRSYPNRTDPHDKIHSIEYKVLSTKQLLLELKQLATKHKPTKRDYSGLLRLAKHEHNKWLFAYITDREYLDFLLHNLYEVLPDTTSTCLAATDDMTDTDCIDLFLTAITKYKGN